MLELGCDAGARPLIGHAAPGYETHVTGIRGPRSPSCRRGSARAPACHQFVGLQQRTAGQLRPPRLLDSVNTRSRVAGAPTEASPVNFDDLASSDNTAAD